MTKCLLQPVGSDQAIEVELARHGDSTSTVFDACIDGNRVEFELLDHSGTHGCLRLRGHTVPYFVTRERNDISVWMDGRTHRFRLVERVARRSASSESAAPSCNEIIAPMPGTVIKLNVNPGDCFAARDPVIIMESMKMEMTLTSPTPGRVAKLHCTVGELVERGQVLATLDPDDEAS